MSTTKLTDIAQVGSASSIIKDLEIKPLISHGDDRGFFREIIRGTDPFFPQGSFAQWSHSKMQKDVVKAWHYHHVQYDWWYIPIGRAQIGLYDYREESPTYGSLLLFELGESSKFGERTFEACVKIPQGVLHGCRVLSEQAHLFYITSEIYNPEDEGRLRYDTDLVPHDWGSNAIVAENDKRDFIPINKRIK